MDTEVGRRWRFVRASTMGTSHLASNTPCQDAGSAHVLGDVLIIVASDGAGTASLSDIGAQQACRIATEEVSQRIKEAGIHGVTRDFAVSLIDMIRTDLERRATEAGCTSRDFACTLLAAVVAQDAAAYFQIGDGAIVVSGPEDPGGYGWVFWPERGEYANVTAFLTGADATEHLVYDTGPSVEEVAVFTDGIQSLVLDYRSRTAHAPFFERMFKPLRDGIADGEDNALSRELEKYLNSPAVSARTDDDKTLILASRRGPTP